MGITHSTIDTKNKMKHDPIEKRQKFPKKKCIDTNLLWPHS